MPKKSGAKPVYKGNEDTTDSRFTSMYSAPIFKKYRKEDNKVKLDDRFGSVLTDKRFRSAPGAVDKYGRKAKKATAKAAKEELEQFYSIEGEDEGEGESKGEVLTNGKGAKAKNQTETRMDYLNKLSRGEISGSSSDSDGSSSGGDDSDSDSDDDSDSDAADVMADEEVLSGDEDAPTGDATARLAIQNIDWDNMTAEDIMVVMQSFCPTGRTVLKVTVYPSDFGKKQMEHEAKFGPAFLSKLSKKAGDEEEEEDDNEEEEESSDEEDEIYDGVIGEGEGEDEDISDDHAAKRKAKGKGNGKGKEQAGGKMKGADFRRKENVVGLVMQEELVRRGKADKSTLDDMENPASSSSSSSASQGNSVALRKYELNKLKYYFAVAECDCMQTADLVYKELDGMELENTSMVFDLRFVPDEVSFEGRDVRDGTTSTSIAPSYKPPEFIVQALQHTNVECTWDEGDRERGRKLGQGFSKWKELNESELQQYLASDSEADDEEGEEEDEEGEGGSRKAAKKGKDSKKRQARRLLLGDSGSDSDDSEGEGDDFFVGGSGDDDQDTSGSGGDSDGGSDDGEGGDVHQELSFVPSGKGAQAGPGGEEEAPADETPFERTLRKIAAKKKAKKVASKAKKAGLSVEAYLQSQGAATGDAGEYDMYVDGAGADKDGGKEKKDKKAKKGAVAAAVSKDAASKDELGLMFGEEGEEDYDMRSLVRAQKEKERAAEGGKAKKGRKRGKKGAEEEGGDESAPAGAGTKKGGVQGDFSIDVKDGRFAHLMEGDSRYGIDPLASEFKDTEGMRTIMGEQRKRRKKGEKKKRQQGEGEGEGQEQEQGSSVDISALKDRLKRRKQQ